VYRRDGRQALSDKTIPFIVESVMIMTLAIRAEALFLSCLQPSDHPTFDEVVSAVGHSLRTHGGAAGCVDAFAAQYGEHPELAASRMRWALSVAQIEWPIARAS
jgi:hypothetical protein